MRSTVGVLARAAFWVAVLMIVIDAVNTLWSRGNRPLSVAALVFFPITLFAWPIKHHEYTSLGISMWQLLLAAMIAYPISTIIGRLPSIDRPGDL